MQPTDPTPAPPSDAERLREIAREFCKAKGWKLTDVDGREFLGIADRLEAREARLATLERLAAACVDRFFAALKEGAQP